MSETMLAMVALMITVFFALSQQRGTLQAEREMASIELEVLAHAVGSDVMQQIAVKPFDVATVGVNPRHVTLLDLTASAAFGNGLLCPSVCNDVDDFNQMQPDTVFFEVGRDESGDPQGFSFAVTASVKYVDGAGNEAATPTWTKEVTLFIDQATTGSETKYLLRPIQLKRQFSPQ